MAKNLADDWSIKFFVVLAGTAMGFGFNIFVTALGILYQNHINKKFKMWEESEELRFLKKLDRMQFPPTASFETLFLPK